MEKKKRDPIIDIMKGCGIACVVAGHAGAPFVRFLYLFHLPLFLMVSGWLFNAEVIKSWESLGRFVVRKIQLLWLPYFFWNAIFTLLHNVFLRLNVYTGDPRLFEYAVGSFVSVKSPLTLQQMMPNILHGLYFRGGTEMGGTLWFLEMLFEIAVLYAALGFVAEKLLGKQKVMRAQSILSAAFLLAGYVCSQKGISVLSFERTFSCYCLYHVGVMLRGSGLENKEWSAAVHIGALFLSLLILLGMNQLGVIELGSNIITNPAYLLVVSISGWQFVREIAWLISHVPWLFQFTRKMGECSQEIMILHFLSFKLASFLIVRWEHLPDLAIAAFPTLRMGKTWVLYTVVGVMLPMAAALLEFGKSGLKLVLKKRESAAQ